MLASVAALIALGNSDLVAERVDWAMRLRRLDAAWVKASDDQKAKAIPLFNSSAMGYYALDFGGVCKGLDLATATLEGRKPQPGDALIFRVNPQIYEPGEEVEVRLGWAYPGSEQLKVKWEGQEFTLKPGETVVKKIKTQMRMMPMIYPPFHDSVRGSENLVVNGVKFDSGSAWLVNARRFETMRLSKESIWAGLSEQTGQARSTGVESPLVVADGVARMDSVAAEKNEDLMPLYATEGETVIRICAPGAPFGRIKDFKKVMIVLHGAGGSENTFPDSFTAGKFVKQATDDGWLVLSPRATFSAVADCKAWLKWQGVAMEKLVIAGHSTGGGLALLEAGDDVDVVVVFAPVGGKVPEGVPFFVGVGESDLPMLKTTIDELGGFATEFKKYKLAEHLMVVNEAAADAWAFVKREAAN